MYSYEVPHTADASKGWGPIRRNGKGILPTTAVIDATGYQMTTTFEIFQRARARNPTGNCFGWRPVNSKGEAGPFKWITYEQAGKQAEAFGAGLVNLGLCPEREDTELQNRGLLGFYSKNRVEWVVAEKGCDGQAIVCCPMYDTLGADSVRYVVDQTQMPTLFCSAEVFHNVVDVKGMCPCLEAVIVAEEPTPEQRQAGESAGLKVFSFNEVIQSGEKQPQPLRPPSPADVFTFCYTSGTTGDPKGALLTHENIVSDLAAALAQLSGDSRTKGWGEVHLSYLPLPHVFERTIQQVVHVEGGAIGFYQGDTLKILEDLTALRPTAFPSVPRLLNRVHDKLRQGIVEAGGIKQTLFETGFAAKKEGLKRGEVNHWLWDKIIFNKIREKVGLDRCKVIVTGSAPISSDVMDFLRIAFACVVLEGYGQTECAAAATMTWPTDTTVGHVGLPLGVNDVRLQDVPDMGYLSADRTHKMDKGSIPCLGRGEICYRGPNVFRGYYKMPQKTAEAIDSEGWLHSGDIGIWLPDGKLKIVDRKKNIFKLAQGEYVAPEKIENIYVGSPVVMQCFVHGDSLQNFLVGVVVPDPDVLGEWAKKKGKTGSMAELCKDPEVNKYILDTLTKLGKERQLSGFEMVKAVYLEPDQWQPGGAMLTPTFKLQRAKARDVYAAEIDALYASVPPAPSKL
mmetsp:Transcript_35796/g.80554  ORF Transcript_35796/g.80554 Transcript_35796/m.80554 type:complete len:680 (-) Transcript_35796:175-2214(-)